MRGKKAKNNIYSTVPLDYKAIARMVVKDLKRSKVYNNFVANYTREDVRRMLKNPHSYERQLRQLSQFLYARSTHYMRLVEHFALMPTWSYIVVPTGVDTSKVKPKTMKTQFQRFADFIETFNLKHEFKKASLVAWRDDVFYGYEVRNGDSMQFMMLDPDYCAISSMEDGVFNFAFDFNYFGSRPYEMKLHMFPEEFQARYQLFAQDPINYRWQELSTDRQIVLKVNEDRIYGLPPFVGIFEELFEIEDFKNLRKIKEEISNYAVLAQQIPMDEKSQNANDFKIDLDTAMQFHNKATEALPEHVGLITSPMKIQSFSFSKDKIDVDNVAAAERDLYTKIGVSQILFNTDSSTAVGVGASLITDEALVFAWLTQVERWLNRRAKKENSLKNAPFKTQLLNVTHHNQKETFEMILEGATVGLPVKMMAVAVLGLSPSAMLNMTFLENDVLNLHETLVPLQSSHTQNGKDGGAPKKPDDKLSTEGIKSRNKQQS